LFRYRKALAVFARVFNKTKERFVFQLRGLQLADDRLRFYIKPQDGMQLPAIMKWMKQVFAQRYNRATGREGHIWGDRYGSRILAGEPPFPEEPPERNVGGRGMRRVGSDPGMENPRFTPFSCFSPVDLDLEGT
jgi:hypothetical protein